MLELFNENNQDDGNKNDSGDSIKEYGTSTIKTERGNIHCLTIIGQIEGHMLLPPQNKSTKYEHILPQLVYVEETADIDGMLMLLNTVGGDVEAGLAIAEMISSMTKPTVSLVLGGGHRRSACGVGRLFVYRAVGHNDCAPHTHKRTCYRRSAVV